MPFLGEKERMQADKNLETQTAFASRITYLGYCNIQDTSISVIGHSAIQLPTSIACKEAKREVLQEKKLITQRDHQYEQVQNINNKNGGYLKRVNEYEADAGKEWTDSYNDIRMRFTKTRGYGRIWR